MLKANISISRGGSSGSCKEFLVIVREAGLLTGETSKQNALGMEQGIIIGTAQHELVAEHSLAQRLSHHDNGQVTSKFDE